jgi:cytochrome c2
MNEKPRYTEIPPTRVGGYDRATLVMALAAITTIVAALAALLTVGYSAPSTAGDAAPGAHVYQDCMICRSLDKNDIGSKHGPSNATVGTR